ncbi:MAG TPA: hypothetical protein VJY35_13020, partial [Candidatus Eisenbacteria bacterium]|nr:hypothetical protein [Candidatus Eisenbacteria bacterium]
MKHAVAPSGRTAWRRQSADLGYDSDRVLGSECGGRARRRVGITSDGGSRDGSTARGPVGLARG